MEIKENFNKEKFSDILLKIYGLYQNQREFAAKANINRTYISKYIHKKIEVPPSAHILKRLSNASMGLTTYEELMEICGYIEKNIDCIDISENDLKILNSIIQEYSRRNLELIGIKDFFPEVLQDVQQKLNTLIKVDSKIRKMKEVK